MCFTPKVKIPKQDPAKIAAPTPAPLADQVQGVQFGADGDDTEDNKETSSEVKSTKRSGKSSLRVELDTSKSKSGGGSKKVSVKSRMKSK